MTVVDWNCEHLDHKKSWDIISALYWPDGGKEILDLFAETGEPILPLTRHILHEQPAVKDCSMAELMEVRSFDLMNLISVVLIDLVALSY